MLEKNKGKRRRKEDGQEEEEKKQQNEEEKQTQEEHEYDWIFKNTFTAHLYRYKHLLWFPSFPTCMHVRVTQLTFIQ